MNFRPSEADRGCSYREGAVEVEVIERSRGIGDGVSSDLLPKLQRRTIRRGSDCGRGRGGREEKEERRSDRWLVLVRKRAPVSLSFLAL